MIDSRKFTQSYGWHCVTEGDEASIAITRGHRGCFASTSAAVHTDSKYIHFVVPGDRTYKTFIKFYDWFTKESPLSKYIDIYEVGGYQTARFLLNNAHNEWKGVPQDIMWICLYILRSGHHHYDFINSWAKEVESGIDPYLAMLVLGHIMCCRTEGWSTQLSTLEDLALKSLETGEMSHLVRRDKVRRPDVSWNMWFLSRPRYDWILKHQGDSSHKALTLPMRQAAGVFPVTSTLKLVEEYRDAIR